MRFPKKKYDCIYADPPWSMNNKGTSPCYKHKQPKTVMADNYYEDEFYNDRRED